MTQTREPGLIESGQRLSNPGGREWRQPELLAAAGRAELHHTGWPIGLVLRKAGLAPVPTVDGIEARFEHPSGRTEDFWSLRKDGSYYVSRLFEEDSGEPSFTSSQGHPELSLWFDLRILCITEVILHSGSLYRELGISPDEPYLLSVNHLGLDGREFYVSNLRRHVTRGRVCHSPRASWTAEVTQDYVTSALKTIVAEVANELFVLFDFAQIGQEVVDELIEEFISHRF